MPHDANGHEIKAGFHVFLKARVEEVYANETACNCRIKIDAPEGEPSVTVSEVNTKSLYLHGNTGSQWERGPLPPKTFGFGGITKHGEKGQGFYFADFRGDHAIAYPHGDRIEATDVAMFNNTLTLPPAAA